MQTSTINQQTTDPLSFSGKLAADLDGDLLNDDIDEMPEIDSTNSKRESKWFFIESFDKTKIECKVLLPAGKGPFPVIMAGHGWFSDASSMYGHAKMFQADGYATLIWSARGWGNSGDIIRLDSSKYEVKDVISIINWLAAQPFALSENSPLKAFNNGKLVDFDFDMNGNEESDDIPGDETRDLVLGMTGGSYGGAIQVMSASFDRRIDAVASQESWVDIYSALTPNDSMKIFWTLGFYAGGLAREKEGSGLDKDFKDWLTWVFLTNRIPDDMRLGLKLRSPVVRLDKVNVPVLTMNGKYDTCFDLNQSVRLFESVKSRGFDARMYWFSGGHSYVPRFGALLNKYQLDWMRKHLKGLGIDTGAEFSYDIEMPDKSWKTIDASWPRVKNGNETRLFLHSTLRGGSLNDSQKFLFEFPGNAVVNIPVLNTSLTEISGQGMLPEEYHFIPFDSKLTSASFETAPFAADTEITGIPKVNLWLSALGPDITFFVKLYVIDENGHVSELDNARLKDINIDGLKELIKSMQESQQPVLGNDDASSHHVTAFRLPVRDPFGDSGASGLEFSLNDYNSAADELWQRILSGDSIGDILSETRNLESTQKGEIIKPALYSFDLRGISRIVKAGHRLKLVISTSDYCYTHSRLPAVGIVWHSSKYPSSVELPVVK